MKCAECKRKISKGLLAPMITSSGNTAPICGVCALEISNRFLGLVRKKFDGGRAEKIRQAAIKHYKETKQDHVVKN